MEQISLFCMEWITLFFSSVMTCFPFYVVGAVIVGVVWIFTRRLHLFPKILIRSFFLALLLAPGVVIGHGFAAVPAALAVIANRGDEYRRDTSLESAVPIFVVWIASAVILVVISHFTRKKTDDKAP